MRGSSRRKAVILAANAALLAGAYSAQANTYTWLSTTDQSWTNAANWSNNTVPGSADAAMFNTAAPSSATTLIGSNLTFGGIVDNLAATSSLTINGTSTLTLTGLTVSVPQNGGTFTGSNVIITATSPNAVTTKNLTLGSTINLQLNNPQNIVLATKGSSSAFGNSININGNIAGPGGLTFYGNGNFQSGGGSLSLGGSNTFSGGLTVGSPDGLNGGQVVVTATKNLGTGSIVVNDEGQVQFNADGSYGTPGQLLVVNGNGLLNNTLNSGAIRTGNTNGHTVSWAGNMVIGSSLPQGGSSPFVVLSATGTRTFELDGNLMGSGALQKQGGGNFILAGTLNTATGPTQVGNGVMIVQAGSSMSTGDLAIQQSSNNQNVALNLYNTSQNVGNLSSGFTGTINLAQFINIGTLGGQVGGTLNIKETGTTSFGYGNVTSLTSTIEGPGGIALDAASTGRLTLTGPNVYAGGTTINGGTLNLANTSGSATGTGTVTINSGGNLATGQATVAGSAVKTGAVAGTVVVNSGGSIFPGGGAAAGSLTVGGLTAHSGASLNFDLVGGTSASADQIISNGTVTLDDLATAKIFGSKLAFGTYHLITFAGGGTLGGSGGTTTPPVNPGGAGRTYQLTLDTSGLTLNITDTASERFWSTSGNDPAADGSGTWAPGATTFYNTNPNTANAAYDNASNNTVIIGNGGNGGTITLTGNVRVGGPLVLGSTSNDSGYTIASAGPSLTLAGGIAASLNANINAPVVLEGSQTLTEDAAHTLTITGNISESLAGSVLTKDDAGTIILTGTGSYTGGTVINNGTLQAAATALPAAGGVTNNAVLAFNQTANGSYAGNIGGAGSIVVANSPGVAVSLTGSNGYTGATVLQSGILAISSATGIGSGSILMSNGTLRTDADVAFPSTSKAMTLIPGTTSTIDTNSHTLTLNNILNGGGNLTKAGAGTLIVGNIHTTDILGDLAISAGAVRIAPPNTVSYGFSFSNAGNTLNGDLILATPFNLRINGGTLSGTGSVRVLPSDVQVVSRTAPTSIMSNVVLNETALPNFSFKIGASDISSPLTITGAITGNADVEFTGGSGDVLLGGVSNYTGSTDINQDTGGSVVILIDNPIPVGTAMHVSGSGTFNVNSHNQTVASLAAGSPTAAIINNPLNGNAPGTITINGSASTEFDGFLVDGNGNSSLALVLASGNTGSLGLTGTLNTYTGGTTINGGTLSVSDDANLGGPTGTLTFGGGNLAVTSGITTSRPITVNPAGGTIDVASGTVLTINGSGTTNWAGGTLSTVDSGSVALARSGATIAVTPGSTLSVGSLSAVTVDATQDPFTDSNDASKHVAIVNNGSFSVTAGSAVVASLTGSGALNVNGGATLKIAAAGVGNSASSVSVDSGSGSKLDLSNNALAINYSGTSPNSTIRSLLISGRAGGNWNGPGIDSSTAAADAGSAHKTALGYAEASAVGITSSFFGQPVDSTTELIRYTYLGDANLDGKVNALDFNAVATNFGNVSTREWDQGDFNYDGMTNTLDFTALATNFGLTLPAPGSVVPASPVLGSLVPEPSLAALLVVMPLLRRRRRM
jgi:autotransporter-associated beta strand protein